LDSGASFHMNFDSSALSSLRTLESFLSVLTADGTSLLVASHGTLSLLPFLFPMFLLFLALP
jgi:hypothetical protein